MPIGTAHHIVGTAVVAHAVHHGAVIHSAMQLEQLLGFVLYLALGGRGHQAVPTVGTALRFHCDSSACVKAASGLSKGGDV